MRTTAIYGGVWGSRRSDLSEAIRQKLLELEPGEVAMFEGRIAERVHVVRMRWLPRRRVYRTVIEPKSPTARDRATVFVLRTR